MYGWHQNNSGRTETLGAVTSGASEGTTVTSAAGANTFGNWANLGTAGFTYEAVIVMIGKASVADNYLIDIGINEGGNRFTLIDRLGLDSDKEASGSYIAVLVPVHVPSGAVVDARVQCVGGSSATVSVLLVGLSSNCMGAPGFSRCVRVAPRTDLDAGATANTKPGTYTELVASSADAIGGFFLIVSGGTDTTRAAATALIDIAIGAASSEYDILKNLFISWSAAWDNAFPQQVGPFALAIPAGTRFSGRTQSSTNFTGDRVNQVTLYGLVA